MPHVGQTSLDVDSILGIPRPTKKPSSLRKPYQPPGPKHINKERALAIAKKFKIKRIGKVSVRAGMGGDTVADGGWPARVSLQSEKVLTRRLLLDREKGLETAMNAKDSAVGKCILGRNDYETRKLGVQVDKLDEDIDRRSYQLLRRKSVFVHQRGLTLTQGGIIFDPNATSEAKTPTQPEPLPAIQPAEPGRERLTAAGEGAQRFKSTKSPSYMRPLSCDRARSTDSTVAETERFLATPTMRRYTQLAPDEDSTVFALQSVIEENTRVGFDGNKSQIADASPTPKREESKVRRKRSDLPEIAESVDSNGSENGSTKFKNEENFPITKAISRSQSLTQTTARQSHGPDIRPTHSTPHSILRHTTKSPTVNKASKKDNAESEDIDKGRPLHVKSRRRSSTRNPSTFSTTAVHFKPARKHRRNRVSFSQRTTAPAAGQFNTAAPSEDPRFTELTSNLIPDSAKAFDLYRDMGRLSVLETWGLSSASQNLRKKSGMIG